MTPYAGKTEVVFDPGPQPGARLPAPGRLGLVQAFVNSHHDIVTDFGADLLRDPESLSKWLDGRGFGRHRASRADHARALAVRDGLRALLVANNGGATDAEAVAGLNAAASRAAFTPRLEPGRAEFVPQATGVDGALATILAVAATAVFDGTWSRLKACRQHDCQWAFFDHSRAASGSWCSMRVCGGRAKQRAYYRRTRS